jgi:hypothetical protein
MKTAMIWARNNAAAAAVLGLLLALGLAGAGYFVSTTVYKGRYASNAVTVKGFAEREVQADLALWQVGYSVTGDNLAELYQRSQAQEAVITGFLTQRGFAAADIKPRGVHVNDLLANPYRDRNAGHAQRYILDNAISVRSNDVMRVDETSRALNDLIRQGIVLSTNTVDYEFTKLNDIKSQMLRDATQNARDAAQQFANDAGSRVGSIQSANQGLFSIVSRDAAAQAMGGEGNFSVQQNTIDKMVRVVVTLTYYLER